MSYVVNSKIIICLTLIYFGSGHYVMRHYLSYVITVVDFFNSHVIGNIILCKPSVNHRVEARVALILRIRRKKDSTGSFNHTSWRKKT